MRLLDMPAARWSAGLLLAVSGFLVGCDPIAFFKGSADTVYVTASALNLRREPTTKAPVLDRLSRGQELEVIRKDREWLKVKAGDDAVGWVHGDYVGGPAAVRAAQAQDLRRRSQGAQRPRVDVRAGGGGGRWEAEGAPDGSPLNLSVREMLAGFPEDLVVEKLDPIGEEPRSMGVAADGQAVLEFWGDPEGLSRASLMVTVVNVPDEDLLRNAELAVRFVQNAVPAWKRDGEWMADKLRELTSRDVGKGGFDADGKAVRFEFIKPLGSVRVAIAPGAS